MYQGDVGTSSGGDREEGYSTAGDGVEVRIQAEEFQSNYHPEGQGYHP